MGAVERYRDVDYGKLDENFTLPVGDDFKSVERAAKARKIRFNDWARDVLYSRLHEIADDVGIELPKPAAEPTT